jgi:tetratricopeptide (TPR) repeat protein
MKLGKHNFTRSATIQVSACALLVLLGLILGLWSWSDYGLYGNFNAGLRAYASGQYQDALEPLSTSARRRSSFPYPAELAAKIKVDGGTVGSLEEALRLYTWLIENGHGERPTVQLGQAAARIRLSDHAKSATERQKQLGEAATLLTPLNWPEAKILRAHILLRQGQIDGAKKLLQGAYDEALRGTVEIVHDPLADLFVGLGICAASNKQYLEASRMFRRAHHLFPRARTPLLNTVYLMARQNVEVPPNRDELLAGYSKMIQAARTNWKRQSDRDPVTFRGMDRAIHSYVLTIGWALAKCNAMEPQAVSVLEEAVGYSSLPYDQGRKELTVAAGFMMQLRRTDLNAGQRLAYRRGALRALALAKPHLGEHPKLKAAALHMEGVVAALSVLEEGKMSQGYRQAADALSEAAGLDPGNYLIHRDCGAFYLRMDQKDKAITAFKKSLELNATAPGQEQVKAVLGKLDAGAGSGANKE